MGKGRQAGRGDQGGSGRQRQHKQASSGRQAEACREGQEVRGLHTDRNRQAGSKRRRTETHACLFTSVCLPDDGCV